MTCPWDWHRAVWILNKRVEPSCSRLLGYCIEIHNYSLYPELIVMLGVAKEFNAETQDILHCRWHLCCLRPKQQSLGVNILIWLFLIVCSFSWSSVWLFWRGNRTSSVLLAVSFFLNLFLIALQCCIVFFCTMIWISRKYIFIASLPPHQLCLLVTEGCFSCCVPLPKAVFCASCHLFPNWADYTEL